MELADHIDRIVFLDTETTGFGPESGHRIVEIGAVEYDRNYNPTGRAFQTYLDPCRDIPGGAFRVHGLSRAFLARQPLFAGKADAFVEFVEGALVIIHNAPFDVGFLDKEIRDRRAARADGRDRHHRLLGAHRQVHPPRGKGIAGCAVRPLRGG